MSGAESGAAPGKAPGNEPGKAPGPIRRRLLRAAEERLPQGSLEITWPDGLVSRVESDEHGPAADIELKTWKAVRRGITGGTIGLAEGYMRGEWDSRDMPGLIELAGHYRREAQAGPRTDLLRRLVDQMRHRLRANTPRGSRRNIAAHYDLGNAFYAEWLDPTMTYSSAVFEDGANSLEAAQADKCRRLLALIDPKPGDNVLEIGCGWGSFGIMAAKERGVRVTGLTLSREQHDFARRRVQEEGLGEQVEIVLRDYRDEAGRYDHVASVEMLEAVGERYWPVYFGKIRQVLPEGGRAGIQVITIEDDLFPEYRRGVDFIQKYIFPGGLLPSPGALRVETNAAGLSWRQDTGYGLSYARTLAEWRARFLDAWPRIRPLGFDERFRRMWDLYLGYCEGLFRAGSIDVRQIALVKA